ncbi:MAG TPA: ABC transporter permease [Chitinophagales bacterium]|nr:ABC transporter permease [Chitinophagales bacterium]
MKVIEIITLAFNSIKQNGAQTIITCCIIGFGIMSLVGILTAIDGLKTYISKDFSSMGSNTFKIRNKGLAIRIGKSRQKSIEYRNITYLEAQKFKELFNDKHPTNIQLIGSSVGVLKYKNEETNPNVAIMGVDDNYPEVDSYTFLKGRNFSSNEMASGRNVCVLGYDVALKLFGPSLEGIDQNVIIDGRRYKVIGIFNSKGSSMITNDNFALIPINNSRRFYSMSSYILGVKSNDFENLDAVVQEAIGAMRLARNLRPSDENNFDVMKSDSISELLNENLSYATLGGFVIGLVTLFGAAIGLMNIMLVSVTERTREIGTLMAVGAKGKDILWQFLVEAIVICQLGGLLGIVLGIIIGNIVSIAIGGTFIIPWLWMLIGVVFCLVVGLISGIYPAIKASKQNPIEALRFE